MKRQTLIALAVGSFVCLGLYQTYHHQEQAIKDISRLPLKGETTPESGNVTVSYDKGDMPLVHIAPKTVDRASDELVSDDAFSVPMIAAMPELESIEVKVVEVEDTQPASPWDAITKREVNLQMISLIQGRHYAVINGSTLKRGDTFTVRVRGGKNISLRVADVKPDRVELVLENVTRSITLA